MSCSHANMRNTVIGVERGPRTLSLEIRITQGARQMKNDTWVIVGPT